MRNLTKLGLLYTGQLSTQMLLKIIYDGDVCFLLSFTFDLQCICKKSR